MSGPSSAVLGAGFRSLWFSTGATALGAQVAALALPLLAVVSLRASPVEVGLLGTAQWLPFLLIALPLGVLVDRRSRRPLLVVAELVRATGVLLVLGCGLFGLLTLPVLLLLVLLIGSGTVLFEVAYQSFLPSVVPLEKLDTANSRLQATEAVAVAAGPGLGGFLVQLVGAPATLVVTLAGSLASAVAIARTPEPAAPTHRSGSPLVCGLWAGARFLLHDRVLMGLLGYSAISNLFAQWVLLLFLVDAVRRLGLVPGLVGAVLATGAVGTFLGTATAPAVLRRLGFLRVFVLAAVIDPVVLLVLPAAQVAWRPPVLVVCLGAALLVNGYAVGQSTVAAAILRQRRTPDGLRGRVNACTRMVSYGTVALGAAAAGVAGELLTVRTGLLLGCLGAMTATIWTASWAVLLHRTHTPIEAATTAAH